MQTGGGRHTRTAEAEDEWAQVEPGIAWSDLVLPESQLALLRSLPSRLDRSASVRVLFTGAPGTGKTMACQILGAALEASVFSLDLGRDTVLESDAAEQLLREAAGANALVIFDHADLLLRGRGGSRRTGDALDAIALLGRIRDHGGVFVFTTTATRGVKQDLIEQFDCIVEFPFPESDGRREIWRRLLPADARLTEPDLEELATSFQLSPAAIRDCCLAAALAAEGEDTPVSLVHVARALELEYRDRLAGTATRASLAELRRRTGEEEALEEPAAAPPPGPSAHVRPRLRLPGLQRAAAESRSHSAARPHRLPRPAGRSERPPRTAPRFERVRRPAGAPRRRPRVPALALAVLATLIAAGLGFLAGRATNSSSSARVKQASLGYATLSVPGSWHRAAPPATPQLSLSHEMALYPGRSDSQVLILGSGVTDAPSFLPDALLATLAAVPTPQVVRLGALQFYRYPTLAIPGRPALESVYVLPTTAGTIVGDCVAQQPGSNFAGSCEGVLATLRLTSGSTLSLTPSATYTNALDQIIIPLNLVRLVEGERLSKAQTKTVVVRAADSLAVAHSTAAARLKGLSAGVAAAANTALATAFAQTAAAYRALARAETLGDSAGYQSAKQALQRANSAVATAYAELGSLGYRVG